MSEQEPSPSQSAELGRHQILKLLIDLGPLIAFFAAYWGFGLYAATATLMAATLLSLVASKLLLGHIAAMPLFTAVLVVVLGSLTIWLQDDRFIKMKPTLLYVLFAGILGGGLYTGRILLKYVFGEALRLTDEGWRKLTLRWIGFCLALAVANEIVWRFFSEETWVTFKVFGILPLTLIFFIAQMGLLKKFEAPSKDEKV